MRKALGDGLTEFDFLVLSDDRTRQGALRFLGPDMEPLSDLSPPIPRLVELERLRGLAQRFERDPSGAEQEAPVTARPRILCQGSRAPRRLSRPRF